MGKGRSNVGETPVRRGAYGAQPQLGASMRVQYRSILAAAVLCSIAPAWALAQSPPPAPPAPPTPPTAAPSDAPPPPPAPKPGYQASHSEMMTFGRLVTERAFAKNIDSLVAIADPAVGTPEFVRGRLTPALAQMDEQLGPEIKVISEKVMRVNGSVQYWRTAEFSGVPVPLVFRVVMGEKGKWRGFTASPEENVPAGEEIKP